MPKFRVSAPYIVWVTEVVEAEDEVEALDKVGDLELEACVGNGGFDKMICVQDSANSIECTGVMFESEEVTIMAEEIEED